MEQARATEADEAPTRAQPEAVQLQGVGAPRRDLIAVKKALDHYAPILGKARESSSRSGAGQEITTLGNDLAESVMHCFVDEERLKTKCPKRHSTIEHEVAKWRGVGDFPTPAREPTNGGRVSA